MSVLDTCRCVGSFCTCHGQKVLKDGARFRMPVLLKDGAISGEKHAITDVERAQARAAAYRDHMIEDVCRTSGGYSSTSRRVTYEGEAQHVFDAALADAKGAGFEDGRARTHAAREAMIHGLRNAHRVP